MNLIEKLKQAIPYQRVNQWISMISSKYGGQSDEELLIASINKTLYEWKNAQNQYNHASPALIDYLVYRLNATERHYIALLALAKEKGLKIWPDNLIEPVKNPDFELEYEKTKVSQLASYS